MFCRRCGLKLEVADRFCGRCGALTVVSGPPAMPPPVAAPAPVVSRPPPQVAPPVVPHTERAPPRRSRRWLLAFGLLGLAGGIVAIAVALRTDPAPNRGSAGGIGGSASGSVAGSANTSLPVGPGGMTVVLGSGAKANIKVDPAPPAPPDGLTVAGSIYDVTSSDGKQSPASVALPAPIVGPDRVVYIGHHDGTSWNVVPARVVNGLAHAQLPHLSRIGVLVGLVRSKPDPGEAARLQIKPPTVWGILIAGDTATGFLDLSASRTAKDPSSWGRSVRVDRFKVRLEAAKNPYGIAAVDSTPLPIGDSGAYVFAPTADVGTFPLRFTPGVLNITSSQGPRDCYYLGQCYGATVSLIPVFADGSEGPSAPAVNLAAGPAQVQLALRAGLLAKLRASGREDLATELADRTTRAPYFLFFDAAMLDFSLLWMVDIYKAFPEVYAQAASKRSKSNALLWSNQLHSYIPLRGTSEWDRVVTHEWGHYIHNMLIGDDDFEALPGGNHQGWREADSRGLAMSEDVATFLGQYGTGGDVPAVAGAMDGVTRDYSKHPELERESGPAGKWPATALDATKVEAINASILATLAEREGLGKVVAFIRDKKPKDVIELYNAWVDGAGETATGELQQIFIQERVTWEVRGTVKTDDGKAIKGAHVQLKSFGGKKLDASATTGADGTFTLRAPPGLSRYDVSSPNCEEVVMLTFTPSTLHSTQSPAQPIPPFEMKCTEAKVSSRPSPCYSGGKCNRSCEDVSGFCYACNPEGRAGLAKHCPDDCARLCARPRPCQCAYCGLEGLKEYPPGWDFGSVIHCGKIAATVKILEACDAEYQGKYGKPMSCKAN